MGVKCQIGRPHELATAFYLRNLALPVELYAKRLDHGEAQLDAQARGGICPQNRISNRRPILR
jgi:hypothetical protein